MITGMEDAEKVVKKIEFSIASDINIAEYKSGDIAVLEENTDIVEGTCSGFIVFNESPDRENEAIWVFCPDIKNTISSNFTTGKDILYINKNTYGEVKTLVQIVIKNGNLILYSYSTAKVAIIPAGNYTAYIVRR